MRRRILAKLNVLGLGSLSCCSCTEHTRGWWEAIVTCCKSSAVLGPAYIYSIKADNRAVNIVSVWPGHPQQLWCARPSILEFLAFNTWLNSLFLFLLNIQMTGRNWLIAEAGGFFSHSRFHQLLCTAFTGPEQDYINGHLWVWPCTTKKPLCCRFYPQNLQRASFRGVIPSLSLTPRLLRSGLE